MILWCWTFAHFSRVLRFFDTAQSYSLVVSKMNTLQVKWYSSVNMMPIRSWKMLCNFSRFQGSKLFQNMTFSKRLKFAVQMPQIWLWPSKWHCCASETPEYWHLFKLILARFHSTKIWRNWKLMTQWYLIGKKASKVFYGHINADSRLKLSRFYSWTISKSDSLAVLGKWVG